jgi:hypothetical protein
MLQYRGFLPMDAFISYSHIDENYLKKLHVHLAMLRREGSLNAWSDHIVLAGDEFNSEIKSNLENSKLFLALVSPDYLDSNFCYEKEFQYALQLAEDGKLRIIPIIVEPCDWKASPFSKFKAIPKDGKPVSEWTNKNNAYLDIITSLRRIIEAEGKEVINNFENKSNNIMAVSGRHVRLKRDFDSIDKAEFADKAYEIIRTYFEGSCAELNDVDENLKAKFEPMSKVAFTCTVVNRAKKSGGEAHVTVYNSKKERDIGDIYYVYQRYANPNVSNGHINVEADDYNLYLNLNSYNAHNAEGKIKYTPEIVAEILWKEFVQKAGIEYE